MVTEDFKVWIPCGQEDTEALPRRKDARKGNPVGNGGRGCGHRYTVGINVHRKDS